MSKPWRHGIRAGVAALGLLAGVAVAGYWVPLVKDNLHDPESPAIGVLQEPAEALSKLPPDPAGNQVDWIKAIEDGVIQPRTGLHSREPMRMRDDFILLENTGEMPMVRFPHRSHTLWLDCKNCHEKYFVSRAGANPINMYKILQGEYCGRCHGAVAFPLTECKRCHSVPRKKD